MSWDDVYWAAETDAGKAVKLIDELNQAKAEVERLQSLLILRDQEIEHRFADQTRLRTEVDRLQAVADAARRWTKAWQEFSDAGQVSHWSACSAAGTVEDEPCDCGLDALRHAQARVRRLLDGSEVTP